MAADSMGAAAYSSDDSIAADYMGAAAYSSDASITADSMGAAAYSSDASIAALLPLCLVLMIPMFIIPVYLIFVGILSEPSISIQDLYVPSLVRLPEVLNHKAEFNASVFVDFKFERALSFSRPSFQNLRLTLFYGEYRRNASLGTHMIPGFSMGWKTTVHKKAAMEVVGMPWEEAFRVTSAGNMVAMVVELVVSERPHAVTALVWVDDSGHMVSMNPI